MPGIARLAFGTQNIVGTITSLSPSLPLSLSLFVPFFPSLALWLSLHLRAMVVSLWPASCGHEPQLPLTRARGPEGSQMESFISHILF